MIYGVNCSGLKNRLLWVNQTHNSSSKGAIKPKRNLTQETRRRKNRVSEANMPNHPEGLIQSRRIKQVEIKKKIKGHNLGE